MSVTLHTSEGKIKLELYCELAPETCKNFLALCATDYYNGSLFHRNIKSFMMQGGDPTGKGKGGRAIGGGYIDDEFCDELRHSKRGVVSMANRGANKNGSQFFITYGKAPHLNNVNSVFAHVIHGMDVLDKVENAPVTDKFRPIQEIVIESVSIHANPFAQSTY
jgi:peptidyl-prolyl cis-trans isomerase-like 3